MPSGGPDNFGDLESEPASDVADRDSAGRNEENRNCGPHKGSHGGRDHTTVIHAVRQIEKLRASDAELDADIRLLTRQLEG